MAEEDCGLCVFPDLGDNSQRCPYARNSAGVNNNKLY